MPYENTTDQHMSALLDPIINIGITIGDYNGIGPEIIIKALSDPRILKLYNFTVFGNLSALLHYKNLQLTSEGNEKPVRFAFSKNISVVDCGPATYQPNSGKSTPDAGEVAFLALEAAKDALAAGTIHAIVTAPITKSQMPLDKFPFPGHTEYFSHYFSTDQHAVMLLVSDILKVAVVTGHIPLSEVSKAITFEKVEATFKKLKECLRSDFQITKPKIAILGLNPHAGEDGKLGKEENEILIPFIKQRKNLGDVVSGPFPADAFFGNGTYSHYDAVLAMYHDQGLIPFKTLAFDTGVNYTAGLSVIRTSPDHGTAYDIAGKNMADESSFREAIYLAATIVRNRQFAQEV